MISRFLACFFPAKIELEFPFGFPISPSRLDGGCILPPFTVCNCFSFPLSAGVAGGGGGVAAGDDVSFCTCVFSFSPASPPAVLSLLSSSSSSSSRALKQAFSSFSQLVEYANEKTIRVQKKHTNDKTTKICLCNMCAH